MSEHSKAVFLSYASQDAEVAKRIRDALGAAGVEVWFDQSELVGGDAWDRKIRQQIQTCALFIPIVSATTQARSEGYFRLEWRLADQRTHLMGRHKSFLFPVCVDETVDTGADVPDSFLAVQWTRLPGGVTPPSVVARIQRLLAGEVAEPLRGGATTPPMPIPGADAAFVPENSVAVLAFSNLSNDPENEFFSDGISEEVINVLVRVPGLKVSARNSAFFFKGRHTPIRDVARQLGVAYVVEGSVRKAGDRVRVAAQLVKATDGFHVWSDTFTRDLKDIFAVQDEIASLVAGGLSVQLGAMTGGDRVVNPLAYRLFLEGRAIFSREVPSEYGEAIRCYQESLALDPKSALTWAWLGLAYAMAAGAGSLPIESGNRLAREAALQAIALDPLLAKAHLALAFVELLHGWDWPRAAATLRRALELAPGDNDAMGVAAHLAAISGRTDESVSLARKAVDLDPLSYFSHYALARSLAFAGRFEAMERQAERMIASNPAGVRGRFFLSLARVLQGRADEAARAAEAVPEGRAQLTALACARFAQGRLAESETALNALKADGGQQCAYQIAEVHAFRGDTDQAFEWLATSHRVRDSGTALVQCDPLLRKLHADARWRPFLRQLGLGEHLPG